MNLKKLLSYLYPIKEKTIPSSLNGVFEVTWENGKKVLNTKNANYSYGSLHKVFQKALKEIDLSTLPIKNVLVLGFGAGSIFKIIREEHGLNIDIVGVEKDEVYKMIIPMFIENPKKLNLIYDDAIDFLKKNTEKYDLILCDLFIDHRTLKHSMDSSFLKNVKLCLSKNAFFVQNTMIPIKDEERDYFIKLEQVFHVVDLKVYQNSNSIFFCK
mgnify:CR=1 FL=1